MGKTNSKTYKGGKENGLIWHWSYNVETGRNRSSRCVSIESPTVPDVKKKKEEGSWT